MYLLSYPLLIVGVALSMNIPPNPNYTLLVAYIDWDKRLRIVFTHDALFPHKSPF
jgi:hypothetical protein